MKGCLRWHKVEFSIVAARCIQQHVASEFDMWAVKVVVLLVTCRKQGFDSPMSENLHC